MNLGIKKNLWLLLIIFAIYTVCFAEDTNIPKIEASNIIKDSLSTNPQPLKTDFTDPHIKQIMDNYANRVKETISANWETKTKIILNKSNGKDLQTSTIFTINSDGTLKEVKIIRSSGNKEFDDMAIDAIKRSEKFELFPQEYKKDSLDI
ncbi:TonB C-terminal domain-containing protein, partial [bacterium]|nr:TonB C-terminal domain-containing protein [bacterium]